jgi:heme exporter protein D
MGEFLEMGGYALYVWGAYLMCAVALGWEAVNILHRRRRAIDELRTASKLHPEGAEPRDAAAEEPRA